MKTKNNPLESIAKKIFMPLAVLGGLAACNNDDEPENKATEYYNASKINISYPVTVGGQEPITRLVIETEEGQKLDFRSDFEKVEGNYELDFVTLENSAPVSAWGDGQTVKKTDTDTAHFESEGNRIAVIVQAGSDISLAQGPGMSRTDIFPFQQMQTPAQYEAALKNWNDNIERHQTKLGADKTYTLSP